MQRRVRPNQQRRRGAVRCVATPRQCRRKIDHVLRLAGINRGVASDQVLMRGKTAAALRLKHVIGEHVRFRDLPVRVDFRRLDVLIWAGSGLSGTFVSAALQPEPVHLPTVDVVAEIIPAVAVVAEPGQRNLLETNLLHAPRRSLHRPFARAVGARKLREEIVETAVLLNHQDDVFDRRRLRGSVPNRSVGQCSARTVWRNGASGEGKHEHRSREWPPVFHPSPKLPARARRREAW